MWKDRFAYILMIIVSLLSWHLIVSELYFSAKIEYGIRMSGTILISLFFSCVVIWSLKCLKKKEKIF